MGSVNNLASDTSVLIQEYYERKALKERVFEHGLLKYCDKDKNIPKNNSKIAHFHKWAKFAKAKYVAENSDPAAGIAASVSEVTVEVNEIASYIDVPNYSDVQRIESLIKESYVKFVEQAERSCSYYTTVGVNGGSTALTAALLADGSITATGNSFTALPIIYANGKKSFAELGPNDQIKNTDIQRAVSLLRQRGAPKINGGYMCLLNPWTEEDLLSYDADFRSFWKLNMEAMKEGKLSKWAGAFIDDEDEPFREQSGAAANEGTYAAGGDVITTYVLGSGALGVTQIMGKTGWKPKFKVQDVTKTGAVTSIGYRIPFAPIVLDATFGVQIKSVAANPGIANVS